MGFSDSASDIIRMMQDLQYDVDPVLSNLVKRQIKLKNQGKEIETGSKDENIQVAESSNLVTEKKTSTELLDLNNNNSSDLDLDEAEDDQNQIDLDTGINSYSSY